MEMIRDLDFTNLESAITSGGWDWDEEAWEGYCDSNNLVSLPNESVDTDVFQSGDPLGVLVRVNWRDSGRRDRRIELLTLSTDY